MAERQHIFLGHATEDKPKVRELYQRLKGDGYAPWLDADDLLPGQLWRVEIPKAIKSAAVFLACLSKTSVAKQSYVQKEFRYALSVLAELPQGSIYLIPVRLDDCDVPDLSIPELGLNLADIQWVDLFEEDGFDRLKAAISHALAGGSAGPASMPARPTSDPSRPQASKAPDLSARPSSTPKAVSRRSRDPAIKAAWIGAGAVVLAGVLSSPWLIDRIWPAQKDVAAVPSAEIETVEPAAGPSPDTTTNGEVPPQEVQRSAPTAGRLEPWFPSPARPEELALAAKQAAGPGTFEPFRNCARDVCPEMVLLPAGTFMMGSPGSEKGRDHNEGRQRMVTISQPFAMGKTEVTFESYDRFAGSTGREKPDDRGWGRGQRPAINVSWHDAQAYCAWLGDGYRLPTEAEWEYAARAGTTTPFSFGETITPDQVNYDAHHPYGDTPTGLNRSRTVVVGSLPANAWGLHEMHGNVREWVSDWYGLYAVAPVTDPRGPVTGQWRVLRGGSWFSLARHVRAASRLRFDPGNRNIDVGFRCAGFQEGS